MINSPSFFLGNFLICKFTNNVWIWILILTSISVLVACCLSLFLIAKHLTAYNKPEEQKWIVGCVGMVPVYAVASYFSLWISSLDTIFSLISACYEAYTLYSFCMYLIACLGGEKKVIDKLSGRVSSPKSHTPLINPHHKSKFELLKNQNDLFSECDSNTSRIPHPPFFNLFLKPWPSDSSFYRSVKFGVVQYLVLKVFCAILQLLLSSVNLYGDGSWDWTTGYPYLTLIINFSQSWAMYVLVMFYRATEKYLFAIQPIGKFLCIKSVVFVTWWQGVLISILFSVGVFKLPKGESSVFDDGTIFQDAIQDCLICFEMAVAAIAHIICFSAEPYREMVFENRFPKNGLITVLHPMASIDSPMDVEEVIASETFPPRAPLPLHSHTHFLPTPSRSQSWSSSSASSPRPCRPIPTDFMEGVKDVVYSGGRNVAEDIQRAVSYSVRPISNSFGSGIRLFRTCLLGEPNPVAPTDEIPAFVENSNDIRNEYYSP